MSIDSKTVVYITLIGSKQLSTVLTYKQFLCEYKHMVNKTAVFTLEKNEYNIWRLSSPIMKRPYAYSSRTKAIRRMINEILALSSQDYFQVSIVYRNGTD